MVLEMSKFISDMIIFIILIIVVSSGYIIAHESAHMVSFKYFGVKDVKMDFSLPQPTTTGEVSNLSEDDIRAVNLASSFNDSIGYHLIPMAVTQNVLMMILIFTLIIRRKENENK